jgi:two-component system LytT family sensor kinase
MWTTLVSLIEAMSVFLVLSYVYCWSPALRALRVEPLRPRSKASVFLFFSAVSIMGTYLGIPVEGAIANTRAVGSVLAGLIGGPAMGVAVGATAGLHRVWIGGATAFSGAVGTTVEGLLGGLVYLWLARSRRAPAVTWRSAAAVTLVGECLHMGLVLGLSRPFPQALAAVEVIALPMILSNTLGAALFALVLRERQEVYDRIGAKSSALALRVAERTLGVLSKGLGPEVGRELARIVREETGVGAVAVTDTESVLAFSGIGADHHHDGSPVSSPLTREALATGEAVVADGVHRQFACTLSPACPLRASVVVPLHVDGKVVGTVQLYEPEARRDRRMSRSVLEGLGALLSTQLVLARYEQQKSLLVVSELKLLQAQVNPHFLFNSLNTIISITRTDARRARALLVHLSKYFRKNLKRSSDVSTLQEELEHVSSYLEIEKARFQDRLVVETAVDPALLSLRLPTFTLQPLIENAMRHGIATTMGLGRASIRAYRDAGGDVLIDVEDNAGAYRPPDAAGGGLGMRIVDKRIKNLLGDRFGVTVDCVPQELTRVRVRVPAGGVPS